MKVSIIIPVYGVEPYIERCAVSLFEQTYENIEYIFVNDCTKDKSIDILKSVLNRYPARQNQVKIINHERNRGLAAARNTGVDNCTGDYLMHVDSDDYLHKDCLSTLVKSLKHEIDMVFFGSYNVFDNKIVPVKCRYVGDKDTLLFDMLMGHKPASIWGILCRSRFYKNSGVRSIEGLNYSEDKVVVPRLLALAKSVVGVDAPLYYYQCSNSTSYTNSLKISYIKNALQTDRILIDFFTKDYPLLKKNYIGIMKLRTKLGFAKMYARGSLYELFPEIRSLYMEESSYSSLLSMYDRIIYYLLEKKMYFLLKKFVSIKTYLVLLSK